MALISFLLIERYLRPTIGRFDSQSLCAGNEADEQSGGGYLTRASAFRSGMIDRSTGVVLHLRARRVGLDRVNALVGVRLRLVALTRGDDLAVRGLELAGVGPC
jgi:hypothetical protein